MWPQRYSSQNMKLSSHTNKFSNAEQQSDGMLYKPCRLPTLKKNKHGPPSIPKKDALGVRPESSKHLLLENSHRSPGKFW